MVKVAIVYHSGKGHTAMQAQSIKNGAESVEGVEVLYWNVEEAADKLDLLDGADAIVFGCPTYMGNVSAGMKAFQEHAVSRWSSRAWQDKIAGAFTTSTNLAGDKENTLMGLLTNAMQLGMIFVSLGIIPAANEPESLHTAAGPSENAVNRTDTSLGAVASAMLCEPEQMAKGDLETAYLYGQRIANITCQFVRGRR
ncbi:NAD(P)H dehydrogenase (quinone) [Pasteurella testudinis DSM 23072]|uniref:NAD(P)H dehydrogenase (Quinone) n=1 Tax=Pasteurella testudinis DSM 23072 TaxID=1122938 RepID=A0A1W1V7R9_9PAST|nr:flavodoxin family protein [Pasteurella testudinis]SMB89071.1 NAD(P)H dehydrogenase (quinone) [Pasteurella testudinis DSM 23072]SUB50209.1 Trp repressor-binding protein [Pasteurella testudinis]